MSYVKDIALCIVLSVILVFIADQINSTFLDSIVSSFMEVVFAVFAINIASTALVAQILNSISQKVEGANFDKSKTVLMNELKIQAFMIATSILLLIMYHADIKPESAIYAYSENIKYCSKVGILTILLYFIWLTHELGKSLFEVLKADV